MRAIAVMPSSKQANMIDQPEPNIYRPTVVTRSMIEAWVCGTDRASCLFECGTPLPGSEHCISGDDSRGEVVEVDAGVARVRGGDVAGPMVRRPCPQRHGRACANG